MPVGAARAPWNSYVTSMIVGSGGRLGLPEVPLRWRRTECEADDGAVQFAMQTPHTTRTTLALDYTPSADEAGDAKGIAELHHELYTDLRQFKDHAEDRQRKASWGRRQAGKHTSDAPCPRRRRAAGRWPAVRPERRKA